ncbi:F1F0 ATP synthase, subunit alpha, mitochondrial [Volvox carteri f. nagariensis]|uniref:F1F0 ATP synthase, subunit alpha, mitochondrial n=1 Tax=Volvox carteri f. nagariensis TaxID=3068 RepID=D8TPL8_VOLCA|nr:F1F0 ATP synthase, subunit alpha, mitochondrial [Volvox carteri f. nagariensis]EFJ50639.1 F1F0 ATP synthase, subunit alpha, mitochondrial [Volvox carteri f. nagariensis]|eukprot:XP_002948232.1 F1F0 ATP synthase, subunit alpha, mitochondrial [Volvox carteri f. nagariensis]
MAAGTARRRTWIVARGCASAAQRPSRPGRRHVAAAAQAGRGGQGNGGTDEEPDWEAEMSIFKQRISRPNQLATLRELEAKVSVGKLGWHVVTVQGVGMEAGPGAKCTRAPVGGCPVLYARDGLAIVSGLNTDAPLGTKVSFVTGTAGVLLWHRSDNLSFCLVLGDPSTVSEGTPVECKIKGVLQVVDDVKGPITRKDFEMFNVPAGEDMFGRVCDHIGRHLPEYDEIQVEMKNREQINESLLTGVKTRWSGAAASAASAVPSPPGGAVRCVLALVGRTKEEVKAVVSELRSSGCLLNTAVVAVDSEAPAGHQYAAMCCACSIGERIRDEGGHSLVVVDDIRPLSDVWEQLLSGLAGLGPALLREGLVKDERGRDMPVVPPPGTAASASASDGTASATPPTSSSSSSSTSSPSPSSAAAGTTAVSSAGGPAAGSGSTGNSSIRASVSLDEEEGALVEYEGMLVSGAVAQRRGFLSTFFMRAAKMSRSNGGGSMSLMLLVPGTCATGVSKRIDMRKYKTLSPEQLAKLEAALRAKMLAEELAAGAGSGELATEVVEEFISIADGQVVLEGSQQRSKQQQAVLSPSSASSSASSAAAPPAYSVNPKLSITRIGTRAYYKALEQLAPQVRLDLAQADDARRFGGAAAAASTSSAASGSSLDLGGGGSGGGAVRLSVADLRADALARRLSAALLQSPGRPASLAEQVATLFAVQRGFTDAVPPEQLSVWLQGAMGYLAGAQGAPAAMQELGRTGILTAEVEAALSTALGRFLDAAI